MLYTCSDDPAEGYNKDNVRGIYLRIADQPWPWSGPKLIFSPADGYCSFMYKADCPASQPNPRDEGMQAPKGHLTTGAESAPVLLPTYTKVRGQATNLYFLMSTRNPDQFVLMKALMAPRHSQDPVGRWFQRFSFHLVITTLPSGKAMI